MKDEICSFVLKRFFYSYRDTNFTITSTHVSSAATEKNLSSQSVNENDHETHLSPTRCLLSTSGKQVPSDTSVSVQRTNELFLF